MKKSFNTIADDDNVLDKLSKQNITIEKMKKRYFSS